MSEVRRSTRLEKKKLAMAMREKQLGALGMEVGSSIACSKLSDSVGRKLKSKRMKFCREPSVYVLCMSYNIEFIFVLWHGYGLIET